MKFTGIKMRILLVLLLLLLFCLPADAATVINAEVVRYQSGSGSTFVSSGFPFPEGLVTEAHIEAGTIKVVVDSTEVAANITALRGRHRDGSIRSALIQFTIDNMAQNDVLTATVTVDDGVRTYTDPAYVRPTYTHVENCNVILPTSNTYLVSTNLVLRNLLVEGAGSAAEEKLYTTLAEDRAINLATSRDQKASYETGSGLLALWCRTGDKTHFKKAVDFVLYNLPYNTGDVSCSSSQWINPDGRPMGNSSCGKPNEHFYPRNLTYAQMYLMTGYRDFWGIVAFLHQFNMGWTDSQADADINVIKSSQWDQPRFQYQNGYGGLIAATMVGASAPATIDWPTHNEDFADQFNWVFTAMKTHEWNLGDYRDGTIGTRDDSVRYAVYVATFQHLFPLHFMIDYYLYYHADSRIPAMVKETLDAIIMNFQVLESGDVSYGKDGGSWGSPTWGHPYNFDNPVQTAAEPWSLPSYARFLAFVLKTSGEATVNGKTYSEWYDICINTGNISPINVLDWWWKHFGQALGWSQDTPWIMDQVSLTGPATFVEPTHYLTIPGDTPEVYRTDVVIPPPPTVDGTLGAGTATHGSGTGTWSDDG